MSLDRGKCQRMKYIEHMTSGRQIDSVYISVKYMRNLDNIMKVEAGKKCPEATCDQTF
jgi:hypothetical protein